MEIRYSASVKEIGKMKRRICGFLLLPLLLVFLGASPRPLNVELRVSEGDNLTNICKRYLNEPGRWREIARLNRLADPDLIHPGQVLLVPANLLKGLPLHGVVTFVKGKAELYDREQATWREIRLDDRVAQGSRLKTGEESALEITFAEGDALLLRANTDVELASSQKKGVLHRAYKIFLDVGRTVTKIRKVTGEESRFDIRTPSALAMARGTEFRLSVNPENATRCEVLEGEVGISAGERMVAVKEGEGTVVERDTPPLKPRPLLPPPRLLNPAPVFKSLPLDLSFEEIAGAVSSRVSISRDEQFRDIVLEAVIRPGEKWKAAQLEDGVYYLRGLSIDEIGLEGTPSDTFVLKLRVNPLPPYSRKPMDGGEYVDNRLSVQWLKVRDAASTHVQIAEDPEFMRLRSDQRDLKELTYTTEPLEPGTYYFRARSVAEDGYEGGWSDALAFKIIPPPPSPPLQAPEMADDGIHLRWRNMGEKFTYHFQMSSDESFRDVLLDRVLSQPEIKLEKPEKSGSYFVRTSTIDPNGNEGSFSPPQSFEIEGGFPFGAFAAVLSAVLLLILL
ncbi:MAG: LysM peptidoglycan-binding domain-containing protein [Desulfobacteraceae bacterium]|nr:MAG: LysM peptidoglycan-binding domain-containing protein [Desulfobacteraceae bacterium]